MVLGFRCYWHRIDCCFNCDWDSRWCGPRLLRRLDRSTFKVYRDLVRPAAAFLLIILASIIEPNFWILLGLLLLFEWMALEGVVRAEFLRTRNFDYVRAARALGVDNLTIMRRHILPNAMTAA